MLMKKQFQSKSVPRGTRTIWRYLSALFILFTFAIGNVWGATNTIYSFNNDSVKSNLWFSIAASPVVNSITGSGSGSGAKAAKNSSGTQITVQSKATANSVYTMTFGLKSGITVTGVALELGDNKLNTVDIKMGSSTFTGSNKNWSLSDLSLTSSFSITFNGNETSGSSNRNTKIKNITFTYTTGGDEPGSDPVDPVFTYTPATYTIGDPALDLSTKLTSTNTTGAITFAISTTDDGSTEASIASSKNFTASKSGTAKVTVQRKIAGY